MYRVFAVRKINGAYVSQLIHNPLSSSAEDRIYDTMLTQGLNTSGTFEFTIAPTHFYADNIRPMQTYIQVENDGGIVFRGRVSAVSTEFSTEITVQCDGIMSILADVDVEPQDVDTTVEAFLRQVLTRFNSLSQAAYQITFDKTGLNDVDKAILAYRVTGKLTRTNCLQAISEIVTAKYGGYITIVNNATGCKLFYTHKPYPGTISTEDKQLISFGRNLISITRQEDYSNIFTKVIVTGAEVDDPADSSKKITLTATATNQTLVDLYGYIVAFVDAGSIDNQTTLQSYADRQIADMYDEIRELRHGGNSGVVVDVTAVDMHTKDNTEPLIEVGTKVRLKSEKHGFVDDEGKAVKLYVSALRVDINDPVGSYTLGINKRNRITTLS